MAMVSPSILSANFAHLEEDCRKALEGGAAMLHYDVMDGLIAPATDAAELVHHEFDSVFCSL